MVCSPVYAMRTTFKIWSSPVVDDSIPFLNLDVEQLRFHHVSAGTYRLRTDEGATNKYVKFPVDGAVFQQWKNITCLYIKNNENSLDKLGCLDTLKVMNPFSMDIK